MLRARIFCLWEGRRRRRGRQAIDRPRMGRRRHARMAAGRAAQEERHERCAEKGKKDVFSFSRGKDWKDVCFALWVETEIGSQRSRPWVWAPPRKRRARGPQHGVETQLVEGRHLGGLWPPFQLIQLIYLRYLCGSTEREKRMDVCFLLTLYI